MHVIWNSQHFSDTWWWIQTKYDFKQYNFPAQALLRMVLPCFIPVLRGTSLIAAIPHAGNPINFWWLITSMYVPERTCFLLRSRDLCSHKNFSSAFICPWKEHWIFCPTLLSADNHDGFWQYNLTIKLFLQKILPAHNKDFCFLTLAKITAPCSFSVFHAFCWYMYLFGSSCNN